MYLSQSALVYCLCGVVGMRIGLVEIVQRMGMWSDPRGGPGEMKECRCRASLLENARSGRP